MSDASAEGMKRLTWSRWVLLVALIFACAAVAADAGAAIRVTAPPELEGLAARIESIDPADLEFLENLTGAKLDGEINVELIDEDHWLAQSTPEHVAGFARGEEIVLFPARASRYPNSGLDELLRHELAHVLIFRASGGAPVPRWFHEGLATLAATDWSLEDRVILSFGVMMSGDRRLESIEEGFSGDAATIRRSYALSFAFVRELVLDHGPEAPSAILRQLAAGRDFREAWVSTTGETLYVAETRFWKRRTVWNQWVPIVTSSVFLWALVTLLATWAIGVRRRRDRKVLARWEDEEQAALRSLLKRLPEPDEDDPDEVVN